METQHHFEAIHEPIHTVLTAPAPSPIVSHPKVTQALFTPVASQKSSDLVLIPVPFPKSPRKIPAPVHEEIIADVTPKPVAHAPIQIQLRPLPPPLPKFQYQQVHVPLQHAQFPVRKIVIPHSPVAPVQTVHKVEVQHVPLQKVVEHVQVPIKKVEIQHTPVHHVELQPFEIHHAPTHHVVQEISHHEEPIHHQEESHYGHHEDSHHEDYYVSFKLLITNFTCRRSVHDYLFVFLVIAT